MPPRNRARNRRAVPSPDPEPSLPSPASTSQSAHLQASISQDNFDLGNVSGSDDEAALSDCSDVVAINDPDAAPALPQKGGRAVECHYFYTKTETHSICNECQ
jgi:hypothetical protein